MGPQVLVLVSLFASNYYKLEVFQTLRHGTHSELITAYIRLNLMNKITESTF